MNSFEEIFDHVVQRPTMYVGECSLHSVSHFLNGYSCACQNHEMPDPLAGWVQWIESRFMISSPAWNWARILLDAYGSDEAAIAALPLLYREFMSQRERLGIEGIENERKRKFVDAYGHDWFAPDESTQNNAK